MTFLAKSSTSHCNKRKLETSINSNELHDSYKIQYYVTPYRTIIINLRFIFYTIK